MASRSTGPKKPRKKGKGKKTPISSGKSRLRTIGRGLFGAAFGAVGADPSDILNYKKNRAEELRRMKDDEIQENLDKLSEKIEQKLLGNDPFKGDDNANSPAQKIARENKVGILSMKNDLAFIKSSIISMNMRLAKLQTGGSGTSAPTSSPILPSLLGGGAGALGRGALSRFGGAKGLLKGGIAGAGIGALGYAAINSAMPITPEQEEYHGTWNTLKRLLTWDYGKKPKEAKPVAGIAPQIVQQKIASGQELTPSERALLDAGKRSVFGGGYSGIPSVGGAPGSFTAPDNSGIQRQIAREVQQRNTGRSSPQPQTNNSPAPNQQAPGSTTYGLAPGTFGANPAFGGFPMAPGASKPSVGPQSSAPNTSGMSREAKALLETIAAGEGGKLGYGAINYKRWGDAGKQTSNFGQHPFAGQKGYTAAGRYQILASNWEKYAGRLGIKDFSPENQDKVAWAFAQDVYRQRTKRNLEEDIRNPAMRGQVTEQLRGTWHGIKGGDRLSSEYDRAAQGTSQGTSLGQSRNPLLAGQNPRNTVNGLPNMITNPGRGSANGESDPLPGGRIGNRGFGVQRHPISGAMRMHKGHDMQAPAGSPVRSMKSGTVTAVNGYGDVTVRYNDGTSGVYRHVSPSQGIQPGTKVGAGQNIATIRAYDPRSTGPHLHYERLDARGNHVNPLEAIRQSRATGPAGPEGGSLRAYNGLSPKQPNSNNPLTGTLLQQWAQKKHGVTGNVEAGAGVEAKPTPWTPLSPNMLGPQAQALNKDTFTGKPIYGSALTQNPAKPTPWTPLSPNMLGPTPQALNKDTFTGKPIYGSAFTQNPPILPTLNTQGFNPNSISGGDGDAGLNAAWRAQQNSRLNAMQINTGIAPAPTGDNILPTIARLEGKLDSISQNQQPVQNPAGAQERSPYGNLQGETPQKPPSLMKSEWNNRGFVPVSEGASNVYGEGSVGGFAI